MSGAEPRCKQAKMDQKRPKLSLRIGEARSATDEASRTLMAHAIHHHLCVRASYNRGLIILAPHILYERHGDAHVDGVVIERNGGKPAEEKLGTFKLSGLRNIVTISEGIRPFPGFNGGDARYSEKILAVLTP